MRYDVCRHEGCAELIIQSYAPPTMTQGRVELEPWSLFAAYSVLQAYRTNITRAVSCLVYSRSIAAGSFGEIIPLQ